jgi:hypothetical protein
VAFTGSEVASPNFSSIPAHWEETVEATNLKELRK